MTCIDDGMLRAHVDGERSEAEPAQVNEHLASCANCRARFEKLRADSLRTGDLLGTLASAASDTAVVPAVAYAQFHSQFESVEPPKTLMSRLFAPRLRPAWGLAATFVTLAILVGLNPIHTWAQRVLAMLRVQKIAVVSIDPSALTTSGSPDSRPYQVIDQFVANNVVFTMTPGNPDLVPNVAKAGQLAGYPIRSLVSLGAPQSIAVNGETAFQMTINRDRIETLLEAVGRSDIHIPESANGSLIAVHIPKTVISTYGDCPVRQRSATPSTHSQAQTLAERKTESLESPNNSTCTYLLQVPSPTVSVPPNLDMSEIAEAALELAGMTSADAHSFCQTIDWSSTLVVPIPHDTASYETVTVDGVNGTLISQTVPPGNRYSLLWVKNGVIHSLTGHGSSSDALTLAASLR
jgi:hypothetical protein